VKDNLFMTSIKEALVISIAQAKNIDDANKSQAIKDMLKESDGNLLRFLITGDIEEKPIQENQIRMALSSLNEELINVVVNEIEKVIPLQEKEKSIDHRLNILGKWNIWKRHMRKNANLNKDNKGAAEYLNQTKRDLERRRKLNDSKDKNNPDIKRSNQRISADAKSKINIKKADANIKNTKSNMKDRSDTMDAIKKYKSIGGNKVLNKFYKKSANLKYGTRTQNLKDLGKNMASKAGSQSVLALRKVGDETGATGIASKLGFKGGSDATAGGGAVVAGAVVIASLLFYGAYKLYKRYKAQAATRCENLSGEQKEKCLALAHKKAKQMEIVDLKRSMAGCKKSSNPEKCLALVRAKITKLSK
jgi:hypothetical protein